MKKTYTDEFKLSVVKDYYNSNLGVRSIALKYNLPSKNYINNWEQQLIKKQLLPPNSTKPNKTTSPCKESFKPKDTRTPREKHYEEQIRILEAKIAYYENLNELRPFVKKN